VNRYADCQTEREERVHQGLTPFRLRLAEMTVDVEGLGVQGQRGEEDIVRFRNRAADRVPEDPTELELLEIETRHRYSSRADTFEACSAGMLRPATKR
jgi:hypothetical protein